MTNIKVEKGLPYPMGISITGEEINIAVEGKVNHTMELLLYNRASGKKALSVKIPEEYKYGNIYALKLQGIDPEIYAYQFFDGAIKFCDPYAKNLTGCEKWGVRKPRALFTQESFEWEQDSQLKLPYHEVVMYTLHVRGFTRHSSSGVRYPGTFEGIMEKIPYLKELGINQIELMPAYEFNEILTPVTRVSEQYKELPASLKDKTEFTQKVVQLHKSRSEKKWNYWGYTDAYYYVPKAAYSGSQDAVISFKNMVKALHKAGIEVVMQFYFSEKENPAMIYDCIRYWVMNYHIDGVHLMGSRIPIEMITRDPLLAETKIIYERIPEEGCLEKTGYKHLAVSQDAYMYDARKFLKSDEDMLTVFVKHQTENPVQYAQIHYITNYNGFTLQDLVSYERKHNEDNGEDNHDGNDYNYSWNCGFEGKCRKKSIKELREKQVRNALAFILLGAGVPMILSGDEFGNSQKGNNNAYCQDNDITWLNWNDLKKNQELFQYVRKMIELRKAHPVFHDRTEKKMMDYQSCGYPDLSYHGEMAWYPKFENYNRHIGLMYCGNYTNRNDGTPDDFFYIAYNMYWMNHRFALPKLPKGKKWYCIMSTKEGVYEEPVLVEKQENILVPDRCVMILTGK